MCVLEGNIPGKMERHASRGGLELIVSNTFRTTLLEGDQDNMNSFVARKNVRTTVERVKLHRFDAKNCTTLGHEANVLDTCLTLA